MKKIDHFHSSIVGSLSILSNISPIELLPSFLVLLRCKERSGRETEGEMERVTCSNQRDWVVLCVIERKRGERNRLEGRVSQFRSFRIDYERKLHQLLTSKRAGESVLSLTRQRGMKYRARWRADWSPASRGLKVEGIGPWIPPALSRPPPPLLPSPESKTDGTVRRGVLWGNETRGGGGWEGRNVLQRRVIREREGRVWLLSDRLSKKYTKKSVVGGTVLQRGAILWGREVNVVVDEAA